MRSEKYNEVTGPIRGESYQSGKYWIQQLELMQNERDSNSGNNPPKERFTTIDDLIQLAQDLFDGLNKLGKYKYPLDVRKGVVNMTKRKERSKTIKAGSKTYFFDIKETREGKPYLVITESRFKGEGEDRERKNIIIFQENAEEFSDAVSEMTSKLT